MALYNREACNLNGRLIGGDDLVGLLRWTSGNPFLCCWFSGEAFASML